MKYIKSIIAILVIGGLGVWMALTLMGNKEIIDEKAAIKEKIVLDVPVKISAVEKMVLDNSMSLTGTFEARKELNIIAEGQGRIMSLSIEEGQTVRKGQTVAKIDDTSIQSQLMTARASLAKAQKDVERFKRLVDAGAISQQQYEEVKLGFNSAQTNVTAIEQQLKYTYVKSPMTGIVKELKVEEGSFATPGSPIAALVDISRLKMIVKVPETDIISMKKGQKVSILTDVYPDVTFNGRVKLISIQADAGRKYDVEIEVVNTQKNPLKAGMYGVANIQPTNNKEEFGLFVPRKSIVGSVQNAKVYVLQADNTVISRTVEVGETIEDKVLIQSGLAEGEEVVTTGQINLEDGKKVKILNAQGLKAKVVVPTETNISLR